jgi:hypothetical protein
MSDFAQIRFLPNRPLLRELSADRLNTILQEIKRNKPKGERGITVRQDGTGTYIGLAASLPRGGTSTQSATHPFQITIRQDPDSGPQSPSYLVTVEPGTINNLLASGENGFFEGGSLREISVDGSLHYVLLTAYSDGGQFTSCEITLSEDQPDPQEPTLFSLPEEAVFVLGLTANGKVYQIINDNILVSGKQQYIADKIIAAEPGQLPYEIYYVWA